MKIALVHDYLLEYGGAERVLRTLADMYPKAPIYTAFVRKNSPGGRAFSDKKVIESKYGWLIKRWRLYSPLRFLLPRIWGSIDLSGYDLVITSCSGYVARGFKTGKKTKVIAYCHTPPRFLYGYRTSLDWRKYWWARAYGVVVNTPLRVFDFNSAQEVDEWVVNSENVRKRVAKFYRKKAKVIYPPVEVERFVEGSKKVKRQDLPQVSASRQAGYYLIVSRLVGAKGLEEAADAARELGVKLKIAGEAAGYVNIERKIEELGGDVELLDRVSDEKLVELYAGAKGFLALARDEDFGMTVVEAMASGTPVIAYDGGGFRESVVNGKTGVLVRDTDMKSIKEAMEKIEKIRWNRKVLQEQARKFSKEKFEREIRKIVG